MLSSRDPSDGKSRQKLYAEELQRQVEQKRLNEERQRAQSRENGQLMPGGGGNYITMWIYEYPHSH